MTHFAKAEMLIRKPVTEVFEAIVNPEFTTKFWFTKSSGRLESGKTIRWEWEMYNHHADIQVLELELNRKLVFNWGNQEQPSMVEWAFREMKSGTFVSVTNEIIQEDSEKLLAAVRDSTEGFTLVLAGLKAFLEHGIRLNLVADRFPAE